MPDFVYLLRHGEASHNIEVSSMHVGVFGLAEKADLGPPLGAQHDTSQPDTELTSRGRQQAAAIDAATQSTLQRDVDLIVTSPLRRALQTTLDGLSSAVSRLGRDAIVLLPQAQETGHRGSPR